ncbi:hypothetical protein U9M48_011388 [Paspalum notatum var. saurae]|uniref:Plant heme peroxidase family profile domain-containing protein n=1 Tax=Paspalum notatum var. saurae TaxID=547442 RepID=A0AAQ3WHA9_PASNO
MDGWCGDVAYTWLYRGIHISIRIRFPGFESSGTQSTQAVKFEHQLTALFARNGLSRDDMVALSAGHTVGFAHCASFAGRARDGAGGDPAMNWSLAARVREWCPDGVDPRVAVTMDVVMPRVFDNQYFRNLQSGMGLLASDQLLYTDPRSRPTVDALARAECRPAPGGRAPGAWRPVPRRQVWGRRSVRRSLRRTSVGDSVQRRDGRRGLAPRAPAPGGIIFVIKF